MTKTQTTQAERPRKRLHKKFAILLVSVALIVGGFFAWRAYPNYLHWIAVQRALDDLKAEIADAKREFPKPAFG